VLFPHRRRRLHPLRPLRRSLPHRRDHHGQGRRPVSVGRPARSHQQPWLRIRNARLSGERSPPTAGIQRIPPPSPVLTTVKSPKNEPGSHPVAKTMQGSPAQPPSNHEPQRERPGSQA
jgi:hypothetical protein